MRGLVLTLCLVLAPALANAQSFRGPCKTEVLCKGVEPGGGRLIDCLRKHKRDLSVECRLSLADFFLNRPRQGGGAGMGGGGGGGGGPGGGGPRGGRAGPDVDDGGGPGDRGGAGPRYGGGRAGDRAGPEGSGPDGPPPYDRRASPQGPDAEDPDGR